MEMESIIRRKRVERQKRKYPTESHLLSETMQVDIWSETSPDGDKTILWGLSRVDSSDETKSYRRLTIDQLIDEVPLVLAKFASACSGVESEPRREELFTLASDLAELVKKRLSNGEDKSEKRSVLNF
jgi:hypothetical protein